MIQNIPICCLLKESGQWENTLCYFIPNVSIKFCHEGKDRQKPQVFFLSDLDSDNSDDGKAAAYYTASSGTSKVVELGELCMRTR
jgi:hypothetical protein